jgi:hypothetical protein
MLRLQNYGSELVIHLLDAAQHLDRLTPDETKELLRDAAAVLCALVHPEGCPDEAKERGCTRPDFARNAS